MIVSIGVDLVDLKRLEKSLSSNGDRLLERILTPAERAHCRALPKPLPSIGARFAAKEAVMKCLGTGWSEGVAWQDIEVSNDENGAPTVDVAGRARERAASLGIERFHLSLSHTDEHSLAMALAER